VNSQHPFFLKNGRKYYSVEEFNLNSGKTELIESDIRLAKIPFQLSSAQMIYLNNSNVKKKAITGPLSKSSDLDIAVYSENNDLVVVKNNERVILNPLGKGVYVWETISPDGKFILFSFGNQGTFLADLNGNIILNIEGAHFPRFSPDGNYISFMKDEDDGHTYTESDLYVYSLEEDESYKITDTDERIEMYPEWSNNGKMLVYHTTEGEIFITELKFEN
jgi:hypothetical protein